MILSQVNYTQGNYAQGKHFLFIKKDQYILSE